MSDPPFSTLADMTGLIVRAIEDADECGITVVHEGDAVPLAHSSELAALNDEPQYTLGNGPCLRHSTADWRWAAAT